MNTSLIKSALAMTAAFAVGSALATETVNPIYGATFESTELGVKTNDYAYTADALVTNNHTGASSGWFTSSDGDQSVITENGGYENSQALKLQTEGGILENRFSTAVSTEINDARENAKVRFAAKVKFVASDTLECGVEADGDAKFALYAYAPDGGTTNLVIFHKDPDENPTNAVIPNISIDTESYSEISIEYFTDTDADQSFFTVSVNGTPAVGAGTDIFEDGGCWFMTVNGGNAETQVPIKSLCFKGTGMVDDIAISKVEEAQNYTVTFQSEGVTIATTNVASGAVVVAPDPAPTKEHYHLTGWTLNGNGYDFATPVNADITLVADFAIDTHTLTINYTGADASTPAQYTATLDYGAAYSVASPVIAGYTVDVATVSGTMGDADVTVTVTYSAQQQPADWAADPTAITDGTPASTQYPALEGTALATADAKKLTVWAEANNVDFADAADASADSALVNAFLLNCAPAEVADELAEFVLNITIENGVLVVTTPVDRNEKSYNVTPVLKGKVTLADDNWTTIDDGDNDDTNDTADFNFFKAVLSL